MVHEVHTLLNGPIEENCYFLRLVGAEQGILIDPGSDPALLRAGLDALGAKPVLLLATHCHFDHVGAVQALAQDYGIPFACHRADLELLDVLEDTFAFYGMGQTKKPAVDRLLESGELVEAAGLRLRVLATPGHTPGGLCFHDAEGGHLFSGDTLFHRSVGRSDMPGGDGALLLRSIKDKLYSLPPQTQVWPGHGPQTSIAAEQRENPYTR